MGVVSCLGRSEMTASHWNPAKYPIPPEKGLLIDYDPEADILTLWNGTPASMGSPVAEGLMVFYNEEEDGDPQIVTLEGAAKLLRPYLFPETQPAGAKEENPVKQA